MNGCMFHPYIGPYHDGELDAETRERLESHLSICPRCAGELASLRGLSDRIASAVCRPDAESAAFQRIHAAIDQAADRNSGRQFMRTAGLLMALAASLLLVSGVWLAELSGSRVQTVARRPAPALAPEWERVATTLRAAPRPELINDDSFLSPKYAAAVEWMLASLSPTERKPWTKRNS
jgi:anti-sigma factor RsiW